MRLLVVEDEVRIAEILRSALSRSGFAVDAVGRCGDARAALEVNPYDAVILDLGSAGRRRADLLKDMRARGNAVPVLVLTARDAVEHRVAGLDTGADDYLIKPFAMSEVIARIKALLRRPEGALGTLLKSGNIAFDTIGRDLRIGERCWSCRGARAPSSSI